MVYVPPVAKVKLPTRFMVVTAGVQVLPVKFRLLNQPFVVIVGIAAPEVIDKFGALVAEPFVVPNVNVLVTDASAEKPPVPDKVKLVAIAILNTVVAAVV